MLNWLRTRKLLTESEARSLFRQMVLAVAHVHSLGYIHRDLKV